MIESILNQDSDDSIIEIIIADGLSTDGTRKIINNYQGLYRNIQIVDNPEKIVSTGFNRALNIAMGEYIIRVDGHSKLETNFIQMCLNAFNNNNVDCVGGVTIHKASGFIGESIIKAQSSSFGSGGASFRKNATDGEYVDTLAFGAYLRSVFKNIGGYDEELIRNQDDELNFRLIQNGGKIWLDPLICSYYFARDSYSKLFFQYFNYGFYKVRVFQKRRGMASLRQIVPLIFILSLIISTLFYVTTTYYLPLVFVLGSYTFLSILYSLMEILFKQNKSILPILFFPVACAVMHFSYGLGMLIGLFFFILKWRDRELQDHHFNVNEFL